MVSRPTDFNKTMSLQTEKNNNLREIIESKVIDDVSDIEIRITDNLEGMTCFCADNPQIAES